MTNITLVKLVVLVIPLIFKENMTQLKCKKYTTSLEPTKILEHKITIELNKT